MRKPRRSHASQVPATLPPSDSDSTPDMPFEEGARDELEPDLRHRMISEMAYRLYADRGFADGYDMDDWLTAEEEVDHVLINRREDGTSIERG